MGNVIRKPVLFLDIDGTVRHGKDELGHFVNTAEDVVVFPEAVERMIEWRQRGGLICGVTNQGGVALGHVSLYDVRANIAETVVQCRGMFDSMSICTHHPDSKDPDTAICWCRKPNPGAIIMAGVGLAESRRIPTDGQEIYPPRLCWMVGDRMEDRDAAVGAHVNFKWAKDWRREGIEFPEAL